MEDHTLYQIMSATAAGDIILNEDACFAFSMLSSKKLAINAEKARPESSIVSSDKRKDQLL